MNFLKLLSVSSPTTHSPAHTHVPPALPLRLGGNQLPTKSLRKNHLGQMVRPLFPGILLMLDVIEDGGVEFRVVHHLILFDRYQKD